MYTHGLTDRFGSPLISRRDLINGLKFLDARGNEVTPNDKWGKKIEVAVDDKIINVFHKDDWVILDENFVGKDGIAFFNNKVYITEDESINVQTEKILSSSGCTDLLIKAFSPTEFNKPFTNLRLIEGAETTAEEVKNSVKYNFPKVETIKNTKFNSQEFFYGDFSELKYATQMFSGDLTQFIYCDFPSLLSQDDLCRNMTNLYEFVGDLSNLVFGQYMFSGCKLLDTFVGDLSNLLDGREMFANTNLNVESIREIARALPDLTELLNYIEELEVETIEVTTPVFNLVDGVPCYEPQITTRAVSDIASITITWDDYQLLDEGDRAIIVYEIFPIIRKKGWTLNTNLTTENVIDSQYVFTDDDELEWDEDDK